MWKVNSLRSILTNREVEKEGKVGKWLRHEPGRGNLSTPDLLTPFRSHCMLTIAMKTLGNRIRELRDEHDLSLREFAKKLGDISPAHISDIENGRRNPSDDLLHKMALVLNTKFEELKQLDGRLPVDALKRAVQGDPALGFALRKVAEKKITGEEILKIIGGRKDRKDDRP